MVWIEADCVWLRSFFLSACLSSGGFAGGRITPQTQDRDPWSYGTHNMCNKKERRYLIIETACMSAVDRDDQ